MTKYDKANELLNKLDFEDGKYEITDALVDMYDWTKEQVVEKAIKLMQHWILEHDHVDIMELEDYIKQQMEE